MSLWVQPHLLLYCPLPQHSLHIRRHHARPGGQLEVDQRNKKYSYTYLRFSYIKLRQSDLLLFLGLQNKYSKQLLSIFFRSVEPVQRSLSLGLQMMLLRGIGTVPGPVVFGYVIDQVRLHCVWPPIWIYSKQKILIDFIFLIYYRAVYFGRPLSARIANAVEAIWLKAAAGSTTTCPWVGTLWPLCSVGDLSEPYFLSLPCFSVTEKPDRINLIQHLLRREPRRKRLINSKVLLLFFGSNKYIRLLLVFHFTFYGRANYVKMLKIAQCAKNNESSLEIIRNTKFEVSFLKWF